MLKEGHVESLACFKFLLMKIATRPQTPRYLLDNEILLHFHVVVWGQGPFATTKRFAGGALSTKFAPSSFVQPAHDTSWQNKIRWNEIKQHYSIPTYLVTTILFDKFLEQATSQNSTPWKFNISDAVSPAKLRRWRHPRHVWLCSNTKTTILCGDLHERTYFQYPGKVETRNLVGKCV